MSEGGGGTSPAAAPGPGPTAVDATEGRRLHPVTPVITLLVNLRALAPLLLAFLAGGWVERVVLAVLVVTLAGRVAAWWRERWSFDGRVLRHTEGVLNRTVRELTVDRVNEVDLVRSLVHRMFGVAVLRIGTAAGTGGEITLSVLGHGAARALRDDLLAARDLSARDLGARDLAPATADRPQAAEPEPAPPLLALGTGDLVLGGLTAARGLVVLLVLARALDELGEAFGDAAERFFEDSFDLLPRRWAGVGVVVLLVAATWLVASALSLVVTDHRFTLRLEAGEARATRGLFERRETSVSLDRIQAIVVRASVARRLVGLASVRVVSATRGDSSRLTIPVIRTADLERVVGALLPGTAPFPDLEPAPRAALAPIVGRRVGPTLAAVAVLVALAGPWGLVALPAVGVAGALGVAHHRALGHRVERSHLHLRRGALERRHVVSPVARTQSGRVRTTPFQRRRGLATLRVDLAGSVQDVVAPDLEESTAERLLARLAL